VNERDYLAQRAERMTGSAFDVPSLGIAQPKTGISEAAAMALEFVDDCASFEGYAHSLPPEVVKRAGRIRAMLKPKVCERPAVGYSEPPPARCEFCDSE
jgi:hypothetical protein